MWSNNSNQRKHHIKEWQASLNDVKAHPILKTYNFIKTRYGTEPYLYKVKNFKYRTAIAKLRTSSHSLEIERGRYTKPKTPAHQRLCSMCKTVEDEFHFIMECECNSELRHGLFDKMSNQYKIFVELNQLEKFIYLFTLEDNQALTWLGKFIYKSFEIRLDLQNSVWISCSVISLETI